MSLMFRSPTDVPVRVALLSGQVALVGPEWRELPENMHADAVAQGCLRDNMLVSPPVVRPAAAAGAGGRIADADGAYRVALTTMIERDEEGDFTKDALPNINAVSKLCGFSARKEDVLRVFREMKAESGVGDVADGADSAGDTGGEQSVEQA